MIPSIAHRGDGVQSLAVLILCPGRHFPGLRKLAESYGGKQKWRKPSELQGRVFPLILTACARPLLPQKKPPAAIFGKLAGVSTRKIAVADKTQVPRSATDDTILFNSSGITWVSSGSPSGGLPFGTSRQNKPSPERFRKDLGTSQGTTDPEHNPIDSRIRLVGSSRASRSHRSTNGVTGSGGRPIGHSTVEFDLGGAVPSREAKSAQLGTHEYTPGLRRGMEKNADAPFSRFQGLEKKDQWGGMMLSSFDYNVEENSSACIWTFGVVAS